MSVNNNNINNYIYALLLIEVIFFIVRSLNKRHKIRFDLMLLLQMIKFGWSHSLIISCGFALNYSDRFMIASLGKSISYIAFYDAASLIRLSGLSILARPFNLFLLPNYKKKYYEEGSVKANLMLKKSQFLYTFSDLALATFLILFDNYILEILFSSEYSNSSINFSFIAVSVLMNTLFISYITGLKFLNKTILGGFAAFVAFFKNILFNKYLIPIFWILRAALGRAVAVYYN